MPIKEIPGFPGYYVSSNGVVFSLKALKPYDNTRGYKKVRLRNAYGEKREYVHRIVETAFRGEIPAGKPVHHKNAKTEDNRLNNLEVISAIENLDKRKFYTKKYNTEDTTKEEAGF